MTDNSETSRRADRYNASHVETLSDFLDALSHLYKGSCPSVRPVLFSKVKKTHTWRILYRVSGVFSRINKKNILKNGGKRREREKEGEKKQGVNPFFLTKTEENYDRNS